MMKLRREGIWKPAVCAACLLVVLVLTCTDVGSKLNGRIDAFHKVFKGGCPPSYPHADLSPELRRLLASVAVNRTVLAAIGNSKSLSDDPRIGVLDVFVESAQRAGVRNLLVAAFDQDTFDWLTARGVPTLLRPPPPDCRRWVACAKTDLARDITALGYHVLLLDTDILFFRDPMEAVPDGSFDVESTTDGQRADQGGPYGSSTMRRFPGWNSLFSHNIAQLNYGVAWFKGCRRVADTLSHFAERIRAGRAWDQAIFSELMLFPASPKRPWSGRHSVRTLDILLYPNTCNLEYWLKSTDFAGMRPVLLHFNCPPTNQRRARMRAVWQAYQRGEPYLLTARACPPEALSCRPEDRSSTQP